MSRKFWLSIVALSIPAVASAQPPRVDAGTQQLPTTLGPNGGLKVECIFGCAGGGGGGGTVDQGLGGLSPWKISFDGAQPVTQSGTWSISFTAPQHIICDSGCAGSGGSGDGAILDGTTPSIKATVVSDVTAQTGLESALVVTVNPSSPAVMVYPQNGYMETRVRSFDGGFNIPVDQNFGNGDAGNAWTVVLTDGVADSIATATTTPGATDLALVVRNIPSGIQTISGTVTANAGTGTMNVNCIAGCTAGAGTVDDDIFDVGNTPITPTAAVYNDSLTSLTSNHMGVPRMTTNRGIHVNFRNNAGTEIGTSSNPIRTDPTGTTTQPVSGTVGVSNFPSTQAVTQSGNWTVQGNTATNAAVSTAALPVIPARAQSSAPTFTDGNIGYLSMDTNGNLRAIGTDTVTGNVANDAVDSGNPIKIGGKAKTAVPTAVADGDRVDQLMDPYGIQYARNDHINRFQCSLDNIAATLTQCQAAPGAGLSIYITDYVAGSTTTAAGQHLLRYGTGTNCGTGTTTLFPGTGTTARVPSPANTVAPANPSFRNALKVPANNALCMIGVATNTTWIVITGFIAP